MAVYNLHVEGPHEFFANGILVHNCIWALSYLARGPAPAEAGVPSGIAREAPTRYAPPSAPSVLPVPGDIGMLG